MKLKPRKFSLNPPMNPLTALPLSNDNVHLVSIGITALEAILVKFQNLLGLYQC